MGDSNALATECALLKNSNSNAVYRASLKPFPTAPVRNGIYDEYVTSPLLAGKQY
jgi:hypothetical protein